MFSLPAVNKRWIGMMLALAGMIMSLGAIQVFDSIAPTNDFLVPFGPLATQSVRTEHIAVVNNSAGNMLVNNVDFGYQEDFSDGLAQDWHKDVEGNWTVVGGEYRAQADATEVMTSLYTGQEWSDCSIQVSIHREGEIGSSAGVALRASPDLDVASVGHGYLFVIAEGRYSVWWVDGASQGMLQGWTMTPALLTVTATNLLVASAQGSELRLSINGTLVWVGTDTRFTSGCVGFWGYTEAWAPAIHYFDNVIAAQLYSDYREDFSDGLAQDWLKDVEANWTVVGGEYRAQSAVDDVMTSVYTGQEWSACSIQASVHREGSALPAQGVVLRASPNLDVGSVGQGYLFAIAGSMYSIFLCDGAFLGVFQSWTVSPAILTGTATNVLLATAQGSELRFYINGSLVWSGSDSRFISGCVGLMGYTIATNQTAFYFDNVLADELYSGYQEDFSDGLASNWHKDLDANWSVVGGEYLAQSGGDDFMTSVYTGQEWSSCSVQASMHQVGASLSQGVVLRASPDLDVNAVGHCYLFVIGGGSYSVWWCDGVFSAPLKFWTASPAILGGNGTNVLVASAQGNELRLSINGTLVWAGSDTRFSRGYVGVVGNTAVLYPITNYFDNVMVTVDPPSANTKACGPFMVSNLPAYPVVLTPGASLIFDVIYAPTAVGAHQSAVIVANNDKETPQVAVAVTGSAAVNAGPAGVSASDGAYLNKVLITWNAVSWAASYEVWRNTSNNSGTAVKISGPDPTGTSYEDTSAAADTSYYYWVKAVNAWNASGFSAPDSGFPGVVGPLITANGLVGDVYLNSGDPATIAVQMMNIEPYLGVAVDWWLVAFAHSGGWYYLDSAMQWASFCGDLALCQPVYQGPLFSLSSTPVLSGYTLPRGTYDFWFAVDYPMDGILNLAGPIMYNNVTVVVQ